MSAITIAELNGLSGLGRVTDPQWSAYSVQKRYGILRKAGYGSADASRWALRAEVPPGVLGRSARVRAPQRARARTALTASHLPSIFTKAGQERAAASTAADTEAWFRRMGRARYAGLPRRRGRPLTRNEWINLRRDHPEILRDWLSSGKYSPPPSAIFPQDSTGAMVSRTQVGPISRERAPDWKPLKTFSEVARVQAETQAARGKSVYRGSRWEGGKVTPPKLRTDRLKALTKGSAAFRQMTTHEKIAYLGKIRFSFQGKDLNRLNKAVLWYQQRLKREMAPVRDMVTATERRSDPARELREEHARKLAAAKRARGWLNQVRARSAHVSAGLPGYQAPHAAWSAQAPAPTPPPFAQQARHGQIISRGFPYAGTPTASLTKGAF